MTRRNSTAIIIIFLILSFDTVVYKYQVDNSSNVTVLRCYPTVEIFPPGDSNRNINYDTVYRVIK